VINWTFRIKRDAPSVVVSIRKDGQYWVHYRGDRWPYGSLWRDLEGAYWKACEMHASHTRARAQ
jgi:hypothetical protein